MELIDNLFKEISKGVGQIQERSQELIKAYNLSQEIKDLEQQKIDRLVAIGTLIFDKYEHQAEPNEDSLQKKCKEITAIGQDIVRLKEQLEILKSEPEK